MLPCDLANPESIVCAQVMGIPGRDLNYDETVVYNNEAIRPVYLITYGSQREKGGKLGRRRR